MWSNADEGQLQNPDGQLLGGLRVDLALAVWALGHPIYKPEFWDKIQELDQWTNKYDPVMTCQPLGLPRHGTPTRIIQTDKDVIFFYRTECRLRWRKQRNSATSPRMVAQRNAQTASLATYYGYSIGTWEGDTLVIDST